MKIDHRFLSVLSRHKATAAYFWNEVKTYFIEGVTDQMAREAQGLSVEDIRTSREYMVAMAAHADVIEQCPQYYFSRAAQELAAKVNVEKIPLSAFLQVPHKSGKIITDKDEFWMWTFRDETEVVISRYWKMKEPDGQESVNWTFSTIDFSLQKIKTNPFEDTSKYLDDKMRQLMFYLFLADNRQVEIKPGRNNGKPITKGKIKNETDSSIIEVTSAWNASYAGMVSGHFRNQPYGSRKAPKHKLIWIEPFKKTYTVKKTNK